MNLLSTIALALGLSSVANAQTELSLTVEKSARLLNVQDVVLESAGPRRGFNAFISVEFGNPCMVTDAKDIVLVPDYVDGAMTYKLAALGSGRICTMIYNPVTQYYKISHIIDPADGVPHVVVNNVEADLAEPIDFLTIELTDENYAGKIRFQDVQASFLPNHIKARNRLQMFVNGQSVFSNSCHAPAQENLFRIVELDPEGGWNVTVAARGQGRRICPAVYKPVFANISIIRNQTVAGAPHSVLVNGVEAL